MALKVVAKDEACAPRAERINEPSVQRPANFTESSGRPVIFINRAAQRMLPLVFS
jgi:hypothetical protein